MKLFKISIDSLIALTLIFVLDIFLFLLIGPDANLVLNK